MFWTVTPQGLVFDEKPYHEKFKRKRENKKIKKVSHTLKPHRYGGAGGEKQTPRCFAAVLFLLFQICQVH